MVSKSMLGSLLEKQLTYAPVSQPFYSFTDGAWRSSHDHLASSPSAASQGTPLKSLHLITWNIDFMASYPCARMASALAHLESLISSIPSSSAVVVFLQEMMEAEGRLPGSQQSPNDLTQLSEAAWVRQRFHMTDINASSWDAAYGTVTLIDRRLSVAGVSRLQFVSEYQRDGLLVDVGLSQQDSKILRLCNVHLDSSYGSMRPIQWKAVAKHLQNKDEGIVASILAGDCNANQPRDKTEPQNNGFRDAYLALGGVEGDEQGATWGFQSTDWKRWGRQRLDKVVFWGEVEVKSLQRVGVDVTVEDETVTKRLEELEELPFVTDHYGLMGEFQLEDGLSMGSSEHAT